MTRSRGYRRGSCPPGVGTAAALVLCGVLLLAAALQAGATAGQGSPRFRIVCHFDCGTIAADALRAAQAAWPLASQLFGDAPAPARRPLEIHLYRTPEQYVAARSGLLRPRPSRLAVTEPHSRTAHIALPLGIADTTLTAHGLPLSVLRVVAHEAFHLAALDHAPGSARLPGWLAEGAASWAEHEALRALGHVDDPAAEPVASTYQWLMQQRLRAGELPSAALILADSFPGFDEQERYAAGKLFFEFLLASSDHGARLTEGTRAAATLAGRRSLLRRAASAVTIRAVVEQALLGSEPAHAVEALDTAFRAHIGALRPEWVQTGRALDRLDRDRWLHVGLASGATAWRTRYAPAVELRGTARFLTDGVASVLIDSSGDGHFSITFDRDAAQLRIEHTGTTADAPILETPLHTALYGEITFELTARRGTLRIDIAGEAPRTINVPSLEPNGSWGLGTSAGASVIWEGLSDRPQP